MQDDKLPAGNRSSLERRLATILVADVFGYSRMMQENEERTIEILRGHREIFDGLPGSTMAEFSIPRAMRSWPSFRARSKRCGAPLEFRLRYVRGTSICRRNNACFFASASIWETSSFRATICWATASMWRRASRRLPNRRHLSSGSVYDQIRNKLSLQFKQLGERSFKNIAEPIRTVSITDGRTACCRRSGHGADTLNNC